MIFVIFADWRDYGNKKRRGSKFLSAYPNTQAFA